MPATRHASAWMLRSAAVSATIGRCGRAVPLLSVRRPLRSSSSSLAAPAASARSLRSDCEGEAYQEPAASGGRALN